MEVPLILLALTILFGPWILIIVLFVKLGNLRRDVQQLKIDPAAARQSAWGAMPTATRQPAPPAPPPPAEAADAGELKSDQDPLDRADEAYAGAEVDQPERSELPDEEPVAEPETARRFAVPDTSSPFGRNEARSSVDKAEALERSLASRWLVWLGAIAISLAGIFLTAYAIEQGILGPGVRVALGVLLGLVFGLGGEWLRRRPFQRAIANIQPDYVPPALSAAGIFIIYASLYVGYAFHGLYPPLIAFIMLAAAGLIAIALSILQGWFVALLGLVGSFLTPALIPSDAPSANVLFIYLFAISAASCAVVRYRSWWPLGYVILSLSSLWCAFWMLVAYSDGEAVTVGIYVLAIGSLFQLVRQGLPLTEAPLTVSTNWLSGSAMSQAERLGWSALVAAAFLLFALVRVDGYSAAALVIVGIYSLACLFLARREPLFDAGFITAAALVCALFAVWHLPHVADPEGLAQIAHPGIKAIQPVPDPAPEIFLRAIALFGGLFAVGGYLSLFGGRRVSVFAGTSAIAPVLLFAIAYWRVLDFDQDITWAGVALALSAIAFFAAASVARKTDHADWHIATGLYAVAVIAFLGLGFAMMLEEAWLTVALALQLPALAWVDSRLKVPLLRRIGEILAIVVLVRLIFNPAVLEYDLSASLFSWILYGYGLPCLAFVGAAVTFAATIRADEHNAGPSDQRLLALLEAGALAFFTLLISFQIRNLVSGALDAPYESFLEQSLQSIAWLAIAYVLMARRENLRLSTWPVADYGARILFAVSAAHILLVQIVLDHPVSESWVPVESRTFIGNWPIVDYLLLAYLVPAGIALAFYRLFASRGWRWPAQAAGVSALLLLFIYVTLEVRHWFQGATLQWSFISDAESYAVSAAWLVLALALLASGILTASRQLRYASLAVLLIAVAKVFLGDMAELGGLYRVAAFLGLGLSLVGIGYIYQRFVFAKTAGIAAEDTQPPDGD